MSTSLFLLNREIKNRLKLKRIIVALILQGFFLFLIFILMLTAKLGNPVRVFFLAETGLVLLAAPLMTSNVVSSEFRKINAEQLFTSPLKPSKILLVKLIGVEIYNLIFLILCFTISLIFIGFQHEVPVLSIVKVHLILLIYMYACGALGILCSAICKNFLYAVEMAYVILAILISDVVLIRPIIRWGFKASSTISLALHANPFTPICAILELDIFRTQGGINLYNLSPIASYGYSFPAWYLVSLWYILGLGGCLMMSSFIMKLSY
ncbi:TPA: hypothetical protein EYP66_05100 [Candidatus Poribacteria bacterium]|nr:hypothetical protein [Candidatus Poribacteria bacterium]